MRILVQHIDFKKTIAGKVSCFNLAFSEKIWIDERDNLTFHKVKSRFFVNSIKNYFAVVVENEQNLPRAFLIVFS